jgi:hypothetical protein
MEGIYRDVVTNQQAGQGDGHQGTVEDALRKTCWNVRTMSGRSGYSQGNAAAENGQDGQRQPPSKTSPTGSGWNTRLDWCRQSHNR